MTSEEASEVGPTFEYMLGRHYQVDMEFLNTGTLEAEECKPSCRYRPAASGDKQAVKKQLHANYRSGGGRI